MLPNRKKKQRMSVAEVRILRWMTKEVTKEDKARNEYISVSQAVASTVRKMRNNELRLFGHV